ncbi:hypothetical protein DHEL01_v204209 [Diaporthe helianthi]|uniref:Uncharacterized protein n=1 Tax=Diaporthe helianthi TaxID=158607 RepID=A0A2P5I4F5_DIAHE|nr:hypothetical protein DHEL01_v204209 [Diaporthe helianthi]
MSLTTGQPLAGHFHSLFSFCFEQNNGEAHTGGGLADPCQREASDGHARLGPSFPVETPPRVARMLRLWAGARLGPEDDDDDDDEDVVDMSIQARVDDRSSFPMGIQFG